jgi:hypothetical protein
MNQQENQQWRPTNPINQIKNKEYLSILQKSWKQIFALYQGKTDADLDIIQIKILDIVKYELADTFFLNHTISAEQIEIKLAIPLSELGTLLGLINGSDLMNNIFFKACKHSWDTQSGELSFEMENGETLRFNLKPNQQDQKFYLTIDYANVQIALRLLGDNFRFIILKTHWIESNIKQTKT